jgi:hypothetical protein
MTNKERKRMNTQFQTMLRISHDSLAALCVDRHPETTEGVLALNPSCINPERIAALNKRVNAQSERIENMLMEIDPRFQYGKNN